MNTEQTVQPTLTVAIALLTADQQILLIKRRKWPFEDIWALPGGKLNQGETLEEAALRELREKTGVQGLALTQFRTYSAPERDPRGHFISTVFVAYLHDPDGVGIQAGDDAKEARWFSREDLPATLAFDHTMILRDVLLEQPHITEQLYLQEILRTYAGSRETRNMLCLGALGLAGESGEVVDQVKKFMFQGHEIDQARMRDELGDVMWYLVLICHASGCTLKEVMRSNVEKLRRRYPTGFTVERSLHRAAGS